MNATERKKKGFRQTITPDKSCVPYVLSGGDVSATYVPMYVCTYVHTHINHLDMKFTADGKGRVDGEKTWSFTSHSEARNTYMYLIEKRLIGAAKMRAYSIVVVGGGGGEFALGEKRG